MHDSTIRQLLADHGFTRKKIQHVALQRRMELRAAVMACFPKICSYGLDQIPKVSLGSMVMHCVVKELYAGG